MSGLNKIQGDFLQYFGVIYGLLLGLLAVATYQNHTDVEKAVSSEASSLAALYRDVTAYPEPQRTDLKNLLREYTRYVIEEAWPLQRRGPRSSWRGQAGCRFLERVWFPLSRRLKRRERSMPRPCSSSTASSNTEEPGFTVSTPASPRSFGIRSALGH